ncbi:hypothetical protein Sste5346_003086 [Sporothrix stenoceras]|uniref:DNA (cytosine-5-)-methyltransferase n=1 Tax=Sporothrix stenoceras TaxID=5173 RepID=A0ABR3ZI04_9PEZI
MPRLANESPISLTESEDEISLLYPEQQVRQDSLQSVSSSSSEDVLILNDGPSDSISDSPEASHDESPDSFPDNISEQTLSLEDDGFASEDLSPSVAHATFDDEPPAFEASASDTGLAAAGGMVIHLPQSTLINPRSVATNYVPPLPVSRERQAVDVLSRLAERVSLEPDNAAKKAGSEFVYIDLDDFEIYIQDTDAKNRLRSLHFLGAGKKNNNRMYFDGVLSVGDTRFHVQKVPFDKAPVDHYGTQFDTVRGHISIRSLLNAGREIYYRLGQPSVVYARFYNPYVWVADLGKHFIDFVDKVTDRDRDVRISHFRRQFSKWLRKTHGKSPAVAAWREQYGASRDDFGPAVIAYGDYLWKEAADVFGVRFTRDLGFFRETISFECYKTHGPRVPEGHKPSMPLPTVVTPYMYYMFKDMAIGPYLQSTPGKHVPDRIDGNLILPRQRAPFITGSSSSSTTDDNRRKRAIRPGDLISTWPDGAVTGSKWPPTAEKSKLWYALVHRMIEPKRARDHQRSFDVVWLYRPEHTPCGNMKYPWDKELFMADHCTCAENDGKGKGQKDHSIQEDEVAAVHSVEWFGGPETTADFFVRQTYLHGERSWAQLRLGHIFCEKSTNEATRQSAFAPYFGTVQDPVESIGVFEKEPNYVTGDTVLAVLSKNDKRSEPYEIEAVLDKHGQPSLLTGFRLRRLLRRNEADPSSPHAPPNELLYTDQTVVVTKASRIFGRCVVRIFPASIKKIPTPYDRGGAGNVFYMTHRLGDEHEPRVVPLDAAKDAPGLRQGFDPATPVPRLRALELFCGCGNLGRGIEDGGATETRCANDIWPVAIHTFMANVASPDTVQPFIGSADTLLEQAIGHSESSPATGIPAPGDIDFISGGSPCQGFSGLTNDKEDSRQYKNRSMVASFASFVDLYRPKFGILENVPAIVNGKKCRKNRREDIFGQLLCSLVGLGYQLRMMLGNSWSYGAPQRRQRVFLIFAAPGYQLPDIPLPSHGSEFTIRCQRTIGMLATGEPIVGTGHDAVTTAFPIVSAGQATADLTNDPAAAIDDAIVDICVRHPDHRIVAAESDDMQHKMAAIPTQPYGMGLAEARRTQHFKLTGFAALFNKTALAKEITKAYKRTNPKQLFKTVRTTCSVADARSAGDLHWQDPRALSILEIRRAQGIPDDDLLLRNAKADQWRLVGNAVARQIALALGLSLREAWLGTLCEDRRPVPPIRVPASVPEAVLVRGSSFDSGSEDELGRDIGGDVPTIAGSPTLTTTTTTTATLVTTLTLTTTTTSTLQGQSTPDKMTNKGPRFDHLPFKQNRIFQTTVRNKVSLSPATAPSSQMKRPAMSPDDGQDELSDEFVVAKRPRSWPQSRSPPIILDSDSDDDDDYVKSSKRQPGGDRAVFVDDAGEHCHCD